MRFTKRTDGKYGKGFFEAARYRKGSLYNKYWGKNIRGINTMKIDYTELKKGWTARGNMSMYSNINQKENCRICDKKIKTWGI